jgi:hypothetical protein
MIGRFRDGLSLMITLAGTAAALISVATTSGARPVIIAIVGTLGIVVAAGGILVGQSVHSRRASEQEKEERDEKET